MDKLDNFYKLNFQTFARLVLIIPISVLTLAFLFSLCSIKVLYAVDAFNGFYGNTTLRLNGKLVRN